MQAAAHSVATIDVVDLLPDGVLVVGADGDVQLLSVAGARLLEAATGSRDPAPLWTGAGAVIAGSDDPFPRDRLPVVRARRGTPAEADVEFRKGATRCVIAVRAVPTEAGVVVASFSDVTARVEEVMRAKQDLDRLAYVVSHDLPEPLRAVAGPVGLLARRCAGHLDAESEQFIEFAVDGCTRMQEMLDDLLAYSRVGRIGRGFERVDTRLVVETVVATMAAQVADAGATVTVGELPGVFAVEAEMAEVFRCLISNALKFRDEARRPVVHIAGIASSDDVTYTVTDNGIGIAPENRDRVFELFKRLHGREVYHGAGFGLSLAKRIVDRHRGRIGVGDNPSGAGSQFWFSLPVVQEGEL
jgi:light-regulated signal transduction histidine kinase (bacteriophytochrome)